MKKILILTYRYPFKFGPHCSFGQHIFYETLKKQYDVKGICFDNKDTNDNNFISVKRESNILKKTFKLYFGIPTRQTHYYSKKFRHAVKKNLTTFKPDIIYIEHTIMMQYIPQKILGIKLFFFDDESIIFVKGNRLIKTLKERIKNTFMNYKEKKAIMRSDVVFTISNQEKDFLLEKRYNNNIEFLPYGIDTGYFYYNWKLKPGKLKILFLGNFIHYPNQEAIKFIYKHLISSFNHKQIQFVVVGRNIKKIDKSNLHNFLIYEDVPDVREFYWGSTIFVAPLFYGGGLRTKILEAAACGIPIVMSSLANNGFNFTHRKEVLIADSLSEFLAILNSIKSLKSLEYLQELSINAHKKVISEFSKEIIQNKFINYIQKYS